MTTPDGCTGRGTGDAAPGNPDTDPWGVLLKEGRLALAGFEGARLFRGGASKLVDRLIMSFPWTTRLSVDFLRSRVSISVILRVSRTHESCMGLDHSRSWGEEKSTTSPTRTLMTPKNP